MALPLGTGNILPPSLAGVDYFAGSMGKAAFLTYGDVASYVTVDNLAVIRGNNWTSAGHMRFDDTKRPGWIVFQTWYYQKIHNTEISFTDSPPTFFFLGFILTLTSFLLTVLVLTSQRGLAEQDRIRAEIEYQVNLKAQAEIMRLQLKMDQVLKLLEEKNNND